MARRRRPPTCTCHLLRARCLGPGRAKGAACEAALGMCCGSLVTRAPGRKVGARRADPSRPRGPAASALAQRPIGRGRWRNCVGHRPCAPAAPCGVRRPIPSVRPEPLSRSCPRQRRRGPPPEASRPWLAGQYESYTFLRIVSPASLPWNLAGALILAGVRKKYPKRRGRRPRQHTHNISVLHQPLRWTSSTPDFETMGFDNA